MFESYVETTLQQWRSNRAPSSRLSIDRFPEQLACSFRRRSGDVEQIHRSRSTCTQPSDAVNRDASNAKTPAVLSEFTNRSAPEDKSWSSTAWRCDENKTIPEASGGFEVSRRFWNIFGWRIDELMAEDDLEDCEEWLWESERGKRRKGKMLMQVGGEGTRPTFFEMSATQHLPTSLRAALLYFFGVGVTTSILWILVCSFISPCTW